MMPPVRAEHDRGVLAELLGRDSALHAYELGDLDDSFWPYTSWYRRDDLVAMVYHGLQVPLVLALAGPQDVDRLRVLLAGVAPLLPARCAAHLSLGAQGALADWFVVSDGEVHRKMALTDRGRLAAVRPAGELLSPADLPELMALYEVAYPGNYFEPRMVQAGPYVGLRREGRLVAVAGSHVFSPAYRVAALGNVATHPRVRGQGLAAAVVAGLCERLLDGVDHIALNVRADNVAAVRLYERLGFSVAGTFGEFLLSARGDR